MRGQSFSPCYIFFIMKTFAGRRPIIGFGNRVLLAPFLRNLTTSFWSMPRVKPSSSLVWMSLAPPRVGAFCWLIVLGKVSAANNLRQMSPTSKDISNICLLCGKERENIDQLFVH